jgi:DNA-binding transcriptional LysR family regulator
LVYTSEMVPNNPQKNEPSVARLETISLDRLRAFLSVVERGSFTGAARTLGLPKSSVSKTIRQLETELGVQLLQRTSRVVRVTSVGRELHAALRPALAVVEDALLSAGAHRQAPKGYVRVSCPPDLDAALAGYVARFRKQHPGVSVDVCLTARQVDLVAEGFDLALRGGKLQSSAMVARRLLQTELRLFAAPSYLKRRGTPRTAADLHAHDCIGVNTSHGRVTWPLVSEDASAPLTLDCTVTTDDMRFAVELARLGGGVVLLPAITAEPLLKRKELVQVLPRLSVPNVALSIVTPRRGLEPLAVKRFREGLLAGGLRSHG